MNLVPIVISDIYLAYDASPIYQLDVLWAITWKRGVLSYTDLLRLWKVLGPMLTVSVKSGMARVCSFMVKYYSSWSGKSAAPVTRGIINGMMRKESNPRAL